MMIFRTVSAIALLLLATGCQFLPGPIHRVYDGGALPLDRIAILAPQDGTVITALIDSAGETLHRGRIQEIHLLPGAYRVISEMAVTFGMTGEGVPGAFSVKRAPDTLTVSLAAGRVYFLRYLSPHYPNPTLELVDLTATSRWEVGTPYYRQPDISLPQFR